MTDRLCDLDLGTGANDGTSWANAYQTFQAAVTGSSDGDRTFVQGSETNAATQGLDLAGGVSTIANPPIFYGVKEGTTNDPVEAADIVDDRNDANMPSFTVTDAGADIRFTNFYATIFGMKFDAVDIISPSGNTSIIFEECHLISDTIAVGSGSGSRILRFLNCKLETDGTPAAYILGQGGPFTWEGGELVGSPTALLANSSAFSTFEIVGVDLSSMGSGDLVNFTTRPLWVNIDSCKLGTNFVVEDDVGDVLDWQSGVKLHLSDSGTGITNPITTFFEHYHMGVVRDETTIVRLSGASDGTTAHSIKMTVNDNTVREAWLSLKSPRLIGWVGNAGTSQNFDVFIHNTTGDFDDDEVWLELFIPVNDSAQMARNTTLPAPLATVAAITDNTSTWNGSANFSQRLRITATPDHEGPVFGYVHFAKRGTSIEDLFVDPQIVIANA